MASRVQESRALYEEGGGVNARAAWLAWSVCGLTLALISSRRPRNPVGWIVAGHAFCFSFGEFSR